MHRTSQSFAGIVLGLWACSGCSADGGDTTTPSWTGIVVEDGSSSGGSSSAGSEIDESTSDDGGESTLATTGGAAVEETSASTGTSEPVGGICNPVDSDAPCTACTKTNCCAQLEACSSDPSCGCYMTCVATTADVFGCGTECGVDLFAPGPVGNLVACSSGPCVGACT